MCESQGSKWVGALCTKETEKQRADCCVNTCVQQRACLEMMAHEAIRRSAASILTLVDKVMKVHLSLPNPVWWTFVLFE